MGNLHFDPRALYDAVDAERRARGLTWTELSRELRISTTTIKSMTITFAGAPRCQEEP